MMIKRFHIRSFEVGLLFRNREFAELLQPGKHLRLDPLGKIGVEIVSRRAPWLLHDQLDVMIRSGRLKGHAEVVDLKDFECAIVWIDGRFTAILGPGRHAYWLGFRDVEIERVELREVRFEHRQLARIAGAPTAQPQLDVCRVERDHTGVLYLDGQFHSELGPGLYAFWRGLADARVVEVDRREAMLDLGGQDIMTADKVTLRLNAVVAYRIHDARRAVSLAEDLRQSLYRDSQLVLRAIVGGRTLDQLLAEKEAVGNELAASLRERADELGVTMVTAGIRDVILPGDMKDLLNKVMEAQKAAEANLIARREETAAMRSQANTAKLLSDNPTLMRLRELEVLETIASKGNLQVVLGEKGLADRVTHLL